MDLRSIQLQERMDDGRKTWKFFPFGHWALLPVGLRHCLDLRKSRDVQTVLFVGWFKHFIVLFQSPSATQRSPNRPHLLTLLMPVVPSLFHLPTPSLREAGWSGSSSPASPWLPRQKQVSSRHSGTVQSRTQTS